MNAQPDELASATPAAPEAPRRLPFAYAKRHGVLVNKWDNGRAIVWCRPDVSAATQAEVRSYLGAPITLESNDTARFDNQLRQAYEQGSSEAMDIMGDLCDDNMDLSRIAQALPEPEDLLESEDDAPIIRLINALLTEAVKENASDIHIEPYEHRLVVRYLVGISQTHVNTRVEMTFARGLRAILRQDPDVVMVGEIRDLETAEIAVQARLTGHLVLSTLHTNSAVGAVTRLRDMGVEPFLLSASLIGVLAQRVVRLLCKSCKQPYAPNAVDATRFGFDSATPPTLYTGGGCKACNHSGYSGRTGIYEFLEVDEKLRAMIHDGAGEQALEAYAHTRHHSLFQDGLRRVLTGDTSLEEVLRVTQED